MRGRRNTVVKGRFDRGAKARRARPPGRSSRRRSGTPWPWFIALWGFSALVGTAYGAGWLDPYLPAGGQPPAMAEARAIAEEGTRVSFGFCHVGGGENCVVDGDTIWLFGDKIRIADIDAPETHDYRCASEKALGDRATRRLHELLSSGPVSLAPIDRDEDRYGRKLRLVLVGGESVGDTLVSEGLARYYGTGRRPWC